MWFIKGRGSSLFEKITNNTALGDSDIPIGCWESDNNKKAVGIQTLTVGYLYEYMTWAADYQNWLILNV
jgi:hypothetical protein